MKLWKLSSDLIYFLVSAFDYVHVVNDFERVGDNLLEKTTVSACLRLNSEILMPD